jgi:hypothetical protein
VRWIVVVIHDGPMTLEVFGDAEGNPFTEQSAAENLAHAIRHLRGSFSVYVKQIGIS